jgi:hypothetical protein
VFNSILVLVSHVVDPKYQGDKVSLGRLDMAINMIATMSTDHAFATRAHTFLQQLLSFMDKSIPKPVPMSRSETNWSTAPSVPPHSINEHPSVSPEVYQQPQVRMPMNGVQEIENGQPTDLFALFDYTQDLTQNLGSHLNNFDPLGQGMWSWEGNGFAAPPSGVQ